MVKVPGTADPHLKEQDGNKRFFSGSWAERGTQSPTSLTRWA